MPPETVSQGALLETQLSVCARAVRWVACLIPALACSDHLAYLSPKS